MIPEFSSIFDLLKAFPDEQSCIDYLEEVMWEGIVVSPFAEDSKVYKCAGNKYKCRKTGKYFNVRTGTIFDNSKIPLQKWFLAHFILSSHKKGISSHQLARDIKVTQKSAWFMIHRLRYAYDHPNFKEALANTVEIDETHMGGQAKYKHESKKKKNEQGNTIHEQTPVLGMRERDGNVIAIVVPNKNKETLLPLIGANVIADSTVMTDEFMAYRNLSPMYQHHAVNHGAKEYINGMAHTNGIENFWSHLKRGVDGIYHWVSVKHLQAYVDEFVFRFNTRKFTTQERFNLVLGDVAGKRLKYDELTKASEQKAKPSSAS